MNMALTRNYPLESYHHGLVCSLCQPSWHSFKSLVFSILSPSTESPLASLFLNHLCQVLLYQLLKNKTGPNLISRLQFSPLPIDSLLINNIIHFQDDSLSLSPWALSYVLNCLLHISTWCLQLSTSLLSSTLTSLFLSQSPHLSACFHHPPGWSIKNLKDFPHLNIQFMSKSRQHHFFSRSPLPLLLAIMIFDLDWPPDTPASALVSMIHHLHSSQSDFQNLYQTPPIPLRKTFQ